MKGDSHDRGQRSTKVEGRQRAGTGEEIAPGTSTAPVNSVGSPFAFMRRFAEDMDHLFEDFGARVRVAAYPELPHAEPRDAAPRGRA